jgi:hypothetical protein
VPGTYQVGVADPRFSVSTAVRVSTGNITFVRVTANRTESQSSFADMQDTSGTGTVNPWDSMELVVPESGGSAAAVWVGGMVRWYPIFGVGQGNLSTVSQEFGSQVFLQTGTNFGFAGGGVGPEVRATVLSQTVRDGLVWLQVRPSRAFSVSGISYVLVITYAAGYQVTYSVVGQ